MTLPLPRHKVEELALFYESGATAKRTARVTGVSEITVWRYFRTFMSRALPRRRRPSHRRDEETPPPYLGSPWIGVATTKPPEPIGPDWIGTPVPMSGLYHGLLRESGARQ